ncbi:MAG: phosphate ABC transporter permease PstA [Dehalococcoidia bacterium]|nr:phosphate ABC transporter permease PstA [Dehalococcoidia bacterium]
MTTSLPVPTAQRPDPSYTAARFARRKRLSDASHWAFLGASVLALIVLAVLTVDTLITGVPRLHVNFFTNFPSRFADQAGLRSSLIGSAWLLGLTIVFVLPVSVGTAIWIEEFAPRSRFMSLVRLNLANLAGVPSIIYGVLGLTLFVRMMSMGQSILAGALTLFLMILPMTVIATQEALRQVPSSIREAALALGATPWQVVWYQVLPRALSGILTGLILAVSRAMGETAALIMIGAFAFIAFDNHWVTENFTTLPIQIYNWTVRPQEDFRANAAAGIIVLMAIVLAFNLAAAVVRERSRR